MDTPVLMQFLNLNKRAILSFKSNCVSLVAQRLCVAATMPMVFGLTLTFLTFVLFFLFIFLQA